MAAAAAAAADMGCMVALRAQASLVPAAAESSGAMQAQGAALLLERSARASALLSAGRWAEALPVLRSLRASVRQWGPGRAQRAHGAEVAFFLAYCVLQIEGAYGAAEGGAVAGLLEEVLRGGEEGLVHRDVVAMARRSLRLVRAAAEELALQDTATSRARGGGGGEQGDAQSTTGGGRRR